MLPSKDEMRARFWELKRAVDAKEEATSAMRAEAEAAMNEARAAYDAAIAEMRALEEDVLGQSLFDAKNEMAFIARGLSNQVGEDPLTAPN